MPEITHTLPATPQGIATAAALLQAGALVAFPTETVYGLGGDATNDHAVAKIFDAKNRPQFNPLIVHLPDLAAARKIATFSATAETLAAAFWPGPLTMVLPLKPDAHISPLVTAELNSIALRIPAHPLATALLRAANRPIAAPSANPSGRISPTRADHVRQGLSGRIAAILDGGSCAVGLESTILDLTTEPPTLLRPGGLTTEAIETALRHPVATGTANPGKPTAPGQLASHYAPNAPVRLNVTDPRASDLWIGFGSIGATAPLSLSKTGDLIEAAATLFHLLRQADAIAGPGQIIAIAPIPETGLGRAINDRLRRAAAPR